MIAQNIFFYVIAAAMVFAAIRVVTVAQRGARRACTW